MKYFITSKISENIHTTPEGYLVCIGVPIARTGEQLYADGEIPVEADEEGKIIIDRSEAEVFRSETLASFEGKPVTIEHPEDFVGPDNWKELSKGIIQNVRRGKDDSKDDVIADILITDSIAIGLVKNGLREVSCGYECDFYQVEKGRGAQKGIIGNHLALVRRGRAGSAYAIMDHKGKGEPKMTLKEKMKAKLDAVFAKAQDDALKIATDEAGETEEKDDKSKSKDAMAMDELVKMCQDMAAKIDQMAKPKDAAPAEEKKAEKKDETAKDAEGDEPAAAATEKSLEERLKALEMMVAKLVEGEADEEEIGDEDGDVIGDEDAEDDDFEESTMTGDTASRIEILAPGLKAKAKDAKALALKAAYATKDGKKVIDAINGGRAPAYDSAEKVDMLFVAASELMKRERSADLSRSRQTRDSGDSANEPMTAERLNEINEKLYKRA